MIAVQERKESHLERSPPACEGEKWQRHWYGDVDSHHSHINSILELSCSRSAPCEDGRPVTVDVVVDQCDCFIQSLYLPLNWYDSLLLELREVIQLERFVLSRPIIPQ